MKKKITLTLVLCMSMVMLGACGGIGSDAAASVRKNPGNVYRVIVNDESGAAVQGAMIQFCSDAMCMMGETDAEGIATFEKLEEGNYTAHVYMAPDGYADDETEYPLPEKYGDVTITLKSAQ